MKQETPRHQPSQPGTQDIDSEFIRQAQAFAKYMAKEYVEPADGDIADQMTDRFYSEHNIDDDAEASYAPKEEAKKEWKAFVEKYFDIPYTLIGYADVGWYNLKEHRWVEKKEG